MNSVILSGGDLGGTVVEWPEGQEEMIIDGYIYRLQDNQGIFVGRV